MKKVSCICNGGRNLVAGSLEEDRVLLNRVDTSTAQDIEWPACRRVKHINSIIRCIFPFTARRGLGRRKASHTEIIFYMSGAEVLLWLLKWFAARF